MTIIIGADHRGFELKNQLIEYLQEKNIRVEDMGAYEKNPTDDYYDIARKVSTAVLSNLHDCVGVVICKSGVGVDITCNRFKGIRSCLGFDENQIRSSREDDDVNILALPSEFISEDQAKQFVDIFLETKPKTEEKYIRRIHKLDQ